MWYGYIYCANNAIGQRLESNQSIVVTTCATSVTGLGLEAACTTVQYHVYSTVQSAGDGRWIPVDARLGGGR